MTEPDRPADPATPAAGATEDAPQPSARRSLLTGTFWQAIPQMLPLVFNLSLTPFIIHGLGTDLYGIFLLVMALQFMLASLDGGIGPSANRHFGIHAGRGDAVATTRLLTTLELIILAVSLPVLGLVFLASPWIVGFFPGTAADPAGSDLLLKVMVAIIAVSQLRGLFTQVLFTRNRFAVQSVADTLGYLAYAVGMVLTVVWGAGLAGIAWAFVAQQAVCTLIVVPGALGLLDRRGVGLVPRSELAEFFGYAWKIQVSGVVTSFAAQADSFFVGRFAADQMTPFGTGQNFATTLRNIPMNALSPIRTMMTSAIGSQGEADAAAQASRLQRVWVHAVTGWVAVGAPAAVFGVTAWLHLGTMLPGWVAGIVLVAHGALLLVLVQRLWANAAGESSVTMRADIENIVLKVALTLPVIGWLGALGAVAATLVANLVVAVRLTALNHRRLPHPIASPWRDVPWVAALLCGALSAVCCWGLAEWLVGPVVPEGPLALLVVGLGAAPALAAYYLHTFGLARVLGFLRRRR